MKYNFVTFSRNNSKRHRITPNVVEQCGIHYSKQKLS